ncbi:MAG: D-2-hydroxyacid dehydrogenase [Desulfobacterales bacterium]|nr:D-2-hydroxyacid dehydrogenase [Desulfobacterales bacterium]
MTKLLIFLTLPEAVVDSYEQALKARFPDVHIQAVRERQAAAKAIADADILLTFGPMMTDKVVQNAPRLKWIHALGTGLDGIIDLASLDPGVRISSTRGIHGAAMSEMAFLLMLALSRDFSRTLRNQDQARWERWPAKLLDGKTVGILGIGLIAEDLAPRCKAFNMTVVGISSTPRKVRGIDRFYPRNQLKKAAAELDYLVVLVPYGPDTRGIVDAGVFSAMKPGSYLINIARGGVVNEDDLIQALSAGRIAGAGLDTFVQEPLPPDHPFWKMENVVITAHLGGFYDAYVHKALPIVERNMRCFLNAEIDKMIYLER